MGHASHLRVGFSAIKLKVGSSTRGLALKKLTYEKIIYTIIDCSADYFGMFWTYGSSFSAGSWQ